MILVTVVRVKSTSTVMVNSNPIHVMVGLLENHDQQFLISFRSKEVDQGGLWEFPGGKLEANETPFKGLQREFQEELGITILAAKPFMQIPFQYPTKKVLLDVWRIEEYSGQPSGREGQPLQWLHKSALRHRPFPAANQGIINTLLLPEKYLITPEVEVVDGLYMQELKEALIQGIKIVRYRQGRLALQAYAWGAQAVVDLCHAHQALCLLDNHPNLLVETGADGLHLKQAELSAHLSRPIPPPYWLGASVHDEDALNLAQQLQVDYLFISPVKETLSHPDQPPLGWEEFARLSAQAVVPTYALGGMTAQDIFVARQYGGHGIAGISAWSKRA